MIRRKCTLLTVLGLLVIAGLGGSVRPLRAQIWAQQPTTSIWAQQQALLKAFEHHEPGPLAIRAGNLFDPVSGQLLPNQVVLIMGERITEVGPASRVQIPAGVEVIDLSRATVLPGLIDGHLHVTESARELPSGDNIPRPAVRGMPTTQAELYNYIQWTLVGAMDALKDLNAGFTTVVDQGALGSAYATVALRDSINKGMIPGPRMLVAGPLVSELNPDANTPEAARAAVRELAEHGVDWIKISSSGSYTIQPDDSFTVQVGNIKSLEVHKAIVDEARQRNLRVECHAYGGEGLRSCIEAGGYPAHGVFLTDADIKLLLEKKVPLGSTLLELRVADPADMMRFGNSRYRMMEKSWRKALAAGVKLSFSSGAQAEHTGFPHGSQNEMFAIFVKWGMTPAQALRTAMTTNAEKIGWEDRVGTVQAGKFADIIAVSGNPLQDITEMQRVGFVMKGGKVIKHELK